MASGQPSAARDSVAWRRRERRFRSWLRHERMTVAMALAEKLHHSAQRPMMARVGARDELYGKRSGNPSPPLPHSHTHTHSPAGALQPLRRRDRRWAARVGHGPCAAVADRCVPRRADPRCSGAADGGPAGGGVPAPRFFPILEQVIEVPKISSSSRRCRSAGFLWCSRRRNSGGSAYDRILFFFAPACGAERRHSSSSWSWRVGWTTRSSRFTRRESAAASRQ